MQPISDGEAAIPPARRGRPIRPPRGVARDDAARLRYNCLCGTGGVHHEKYAVACHPPDDVAGGRRGAGRGRAGPVRHTEARPSDCVPTGRGGDRAVPLRPRPAPAVHRSGDRCHRCLGPATHAQGPSARLGGARPPHFDGNLPPSAAGAKLWEERPGLAHIVHRRIERRTDGPDEAALVAHNEWLGTSGAPARRERRRATARHPRRTSRQDDERAQRRRTIRSSEGDVNEAGIFHQPARWVDDSEPVAPGVSEGLTRMNHHHPPNHPACSTSAPTGQWNRV